MQVRKKLIEVALPLEAINEASAREKSIRHGHPSTLHLWWARRPLAAARAVIFAQMVDDPSTYTDELLANDGVRAAAARELDARRKLWARQVAQYEEAQRSGDTAIREPGPEPTLEDCAADLERDRLFRLIEELVQWENTTNEKLLEKARAELRRSWRRTCRDNRDHPRAAELFDPERLPAFHDPFAGGGALPLEAQRLGLESYASDLNPVAVLICKAMIEIPPKFADRPPVNPAARSKKDLFDREWKGAAGLAEDVRYYGEWMRARAEERIGHLYPTVKITPEMVRERPDLKKYEGRELTVIAWLWARTVRSPNPAFSHVHVPLVSNFMLSTKKGKEAYVSPIVNGDNYRFEVRTGKPADPQLAKKGTKRSGANFVCLVSSATIPATYIRTEAKAGRMGARMMAVVAKGDGERVHLGPIPDHEGVAAGVEPGWKPEAEFFERALGFRIGNYGMKAWSDLFTPRQLAVLTTLSDLVHEAHKQARRHGIEAGLLDDAKSKPEGGTGARAYAEAVATYLGLAVSKTANRASSICTFKLGVQCPGDTFGRQALPMSWDYAEANTINGPSGSFESMLKNTVAGLLSNGTQVGFTGYASQADAASQLDSRGKIISTDPPYYDNIGYGDLSDFFYVWLRRGLQPYFPNLFATLAVPKAEELVATPARHGGREEAEAFFLKGMTRAMENLAHQAHPGFPLTVYYAFKQSEARSEAGTTRTGWETFLGALIRAGFGVTGTWPMRTERENRKRNQGANALASSIVLVCRPRNVTAGMATRREFITALKRELPSAIVDLQRGNVAPVDLAQAAIGPGIGIFTRFSSVKESDGSDMSVRTALQLINQVLDETLAEQESDFDPDTRWALAWFTEFGVEEGPYGRAETLSTAKNTSVSGMVDAGILSAGRGKVRLLSRDELDPEWDPRTDPRLTIWEVTQHLIRALETGGESEAASLLGQLGGGIGETARELAYRLYALCERKKWAQEAIAYNTLVTAWPEISRLARATTVPEPEQIEAF